MNILPTARSKTSWTHTVTTQLLEIKTKLYLTRSHPQLQPSPVSNNPAPRQQKQHLSEINSPLLSLLLLILLLL